jgi:hypothetical protein
LKEVKSFKDPYGEDELFYNLSASNGILAITSDDTVVVFDTKKGEILLDYKTEKSWHNTKVDSLDRGVLLYDNLVIFSHGHDDATYTINYNTKEFSWKCKRGWKSGTIELYRYKDRYLYKNRFDSAFYEFNPKSGAIIGKYSYSLVKLANRDSDKHTDVFIVLESVKDKELRNWLEEGYDRIGKGDIYSIYESRFHFHGQSLTPLWEIEFPNKIEDRHNYGRDMFFNLVDSIVLLELEDKNGKILWNMKTGYNLIHRSSIHKDRLYISYEDSSIEVFDLSKLEK